MKAKVKNWIKNIENGNINSFTEKVLSAVKNNPLGISTYQLRDELNMSHQTLTSRLSELNDEGLISAVRQTEVKGTFYSVYKSVSDFNLINDIVRLRKLEKYSRWLKSADLYNEFMEAETVEMINYEQMQNAVI